MIRRTTKIALEVVAGLVAAAMLLLAVAVWRLSSDPVDLNFLTPRIEAALTDSANGVSVRVGATQLVWAGWARTIDMHARNVAIRDSEGATIAVLPDIVIGFSLRALIQGTLAPSTVEVFGARLRLVRGIDGKFQIGDRSDPGPDPGAAPADESDFSRLLPAIVAQLESKPDPARPLSFLTMVRILDGHISVEDRRSRLSWEAPGAVIELRRGDTGITGEVGLAVDIRGTRATVTADFSYDSANGRVKLQGGAVNLHPAALAWLAPQLHVLSDLTTPLSVSLTAAGRADGTIDSLRFDLRGGQGQLTANERYAEPLQIARLRLRGEFDRSKRRLILETGELMLGTPERPGPEITITGSVASAGDDSSGDLDVEAAVTASNVPMGELGRYWPLGVGHNVRNWVLGNVTQGTAEEANASFALRLPGGSFDAAEVQRMAGSLRYRDIEIHYLKPLPPVVEVAGEATFDATSISFRPTGGRLGPLQVMPATIDITGFRNEDQIMEIDLPVVGPLRAGLELLDHDRLALIRELGIDTAAVNGTAAARVAFRFPLLNALKLDDIEIQAQANLEKASIDKFLLGQDARDGRLALTLTKEGMEITGPLRLGGVGVELAWKEAFTDAAPYAADLAAQVPSFDEAARKRFGIDLSPYLEGPVSLSIRMLTDHAGTRTLTTAVNLESAAMAVAPLNWQKPVGDSGEAYLTLRLAAGRMVEMTRFRIDAGALRAKGRGQFSEASRELVSMTIDDLAVGETKVRDVTIARLGEGYDIRIGGGVVDASSLYARGDHGDKAIAKESKAVPAELRTYTPLLLSARKLDRLVFGPDRYLEAVDLDFDRGIGGWKRLALSGAVPKSLWSKTKPSPERPTVAEPPLTTGPEPEPAPEPAPAPAAAPQPEAARTLRIDYGPDSTGAHKLSVTTEDMGGVLRALDLVDTVQGGRLDVFGESDGPQPARPLNARIEARDYVVVDASVLTQLLTVASLTGIVDLLQGEGITFTHFTGDVILDDGILTTDLVRAYGPALGLTIKGKLDFDESIADLEGTVVPAYTINRLLGGIPILGQLLVGGEGEGFLAFIYRISGSFSEPEVKVNALSALAPGFLRGLFGLFDSNGETSEANKPSAFPDRESDR